MNKGMSIPELLDFAEEMEEIIRRARATKKEYNEASAADKVERLAQLIYVCTYVDPHGYPNDLPDWDDLPVLGTINAGNPDKVRYRNAAMAIMDLLDAYD